MYAIYLTRRALFLLLAPPRPCKLIYFQASRIWRCTAARSTELVGFGKDQPERVEEEEGADPGRGQGGLHFRVRSPDSNVRNSATDGGRKWRWRRR